MEILLYYLLISGASIALGATLGRWLFRSLSWHKTTRAFYIIVLLSAWLLPLLGILLPYVDWSSIFSPSREGIAIAELPLQLSTEVNASSSPLWKLLFPLVLCIVWAIGVAIRGCKLILAAVHLFKLRLRCTPTPFPTESKSSFSPKDIALLVPLGRYIFPARA